MISGINKLTGKEIKRVLYLYGISGKRKLALRSISKILKNDFIDLTKVAFGDNFDSYKIEVQPILYNGKIICKLKNCICIPSEFNSTTNGWLKRIVAIPMYDIPKEHHFISFGNINSDGSKSYLLLSISNMNNVIQFLISRNYAVPLFFGVNHWANGKNAIELGIAYGTLKQKS